MMTYTPGQKHGLRYALRFSDGVHPETHYMVVTPANDVDEPIDARLDLLLMELRRLPTEALTRSVLDRIKNDEPDLYAAYTVLRDFGGLA